MTIAVDLGRKATKPTNQQTHGFKFYSCSFFEKEDIIIRKSKEEVFIQKLKTCLDRLRLTSLLLNGLSSFYNIVDPDDLLSRTFFFFNLLSIGTT